MDRLRYSTVLMQFDPEVVLQLILTFTVSDSRLGLVFALLSCILTMLTAVYAQRTV